MTDEAEFRPPPATQVDLDFIYAREWIRWQILCGFSALARFYLPKRRLLEDLTPAIENQGS